MTNNRVAVYKFNRKTGWEKLPDMPHGGRRHFMCGLVTDNSGSRKIVVAGGVSEYDQSKELIIV